MKDYAANEALRLSKSFTRKTNIAEWIGRVETFALGPHPKSNLSSKSLSYTYVVLFTPIPHGYNAGSCPTREEQETPLSKPENHGRHGDFTGDPNPRTGRGHQTEPADLKRKREYEAKYHEFRKRWTYSDNERRFLVMKNLERQAELDELERWMMGYKEVCR